MPVDEALAARLRELLAQQPRVEEKRMFRGLAFMVDGKMCVCASGNELMLRFDPLLQEKVESREGYRPMIMRGRHYRGYGYVRPEAIKTRKALEYWVGLALEFNPRAKASKKQGAAAPKRKQRTSGTE